MAFYDAKSLYYDPILTNFSVGFQPKGLVGMNLFPLQAVGLPSGRYRVFDRSNWLVFEARREPGTVANEIRGGKWSEDTFATYQHSLQAAVTDEELQNFQRSLASAQTSLFAGIDPAQDATDMVTRSLLLEHELKASNLARNTATYPGGNTVTLSGTSRWDNYTATLPAFPVSDPVSDIMTGIRAIYNAVQEYPNLLIIPWAVWTWLENHPRIVDRFKFFSLSQPGAFQSLTGFSGNIVIAESMYNNANSVDDTQNITSLWGKDVILAHVEDNGQKIQTFGKTFAVPYADGNVRTVDRWREEGRKSDLVRVSWQWDIKVVNNANAYLIKTAVS
jgi:hypothetical protein